MKELSEGDPAPPFLELTANKGSTVVVYFYPKDFTPGCTTEACEFRDMYQKIEEADAVVIGVSPDSPESHEKFIAKHGLPYSLIPDEAHELAVAYGVWKEKSMYGRKFMGIERTTFIIDAQGKISHIFPKVKVEEHYDEVVDALEE